MRVFFLIFICFFALTSCLTIKLYSSEQSDTPSSKPTSVSRQMIGSGKMVKLKNGTSEILFYGEDNHPSKVLIARDSLKLPVDSLSKSTPHGLYHSDKSTHFMINSEKGDTDMLIIIDGQQMPKDFLLDEISPDMIERMDIFKGAKAYELYGKQGKNGVLTITLKKD